MKSLVNIVCAAVILVPLTSHATESITRAQVIKELEQLEAAGYNPGEADDSYPATLERAQAVLLERQRIEAASYGPDMQGATQSGH
jgi:hypothetical protein